MRVTSACGMLYQLNLTRCVVQSLIEDLEVQALGLPADERARLVALLIASFEPKSPAQAAWVQLAQSRRDEVKSGLCTMVPGHEALARVRARFA
jgi:hypothetical protein